MHTTRHRSVVMSVIGLLLIAVACGACSSLRNQQAKADECEPGFIKITRDDPQHAPLSFCLAGPDYCKTNSDCTTDFACEKQSGTFAPNGSGVCMPDTVAVLQRIQ